MNPHEMDDELTPEEHALFAALPREREPGRLLEERTVRALRERGVLQAAAAETRRRLRFPAAWVSGAIAAGIALFLGGLATGQYMGARHAAEMVNAVQRQDAQNTALLVQQTGTAYVQALSRLSQVSDTTRGSSQGGEVARQMLRQAASEVVRISPNDPVASGILAAFDRARTGPATTQRDSAGRQSVVWF